MRIAIMTDTNSGMTADEAGRLGVALLPMPFTIDGEAFLEGRNLTAAQFYGALKNGAKVATSQPSPADTLAMWDELLQTNDAVVYLPMSSGLSGTCATARMLAMEEPYAGRVEVVDNGRISATLRQAVLLISRTGHSNLPVYDGRRMVGIVNNRRIIREVGAQLSRGQSVDAFLSETPVGDILDESDMFVYYKYLSENATLEEVLSAFETNKKLIAVVVSERGKMGERIRNIVTPADLVHISRKLEDFR